jgi:hypothetical protein
MSNHYQVKAPLRSLVNLIIGCARDYHKQVKSIGKKMGYSMIAEMAVSNLRDSYYNELVDLLSEDDYFDKKDLIMFAEAFDELLDSSTPKRK